MKEQIGQYLNHVIQPYIVWILCDKHADNNIAF